MIVSRKFFVTIGFVVVSLLLVITSLHAGEITPQRVVDHVDKAVQLIVDKGADEAFKLLTDPNSEWVDGDLYVFVYDFSGNIVAHLNKKLEGKNLMKFKDKNGKVFAAEFMEIAKSPKGEGWSEYWWPKPGEKTASPKVSYIKRVPDQDLLVGVGVYDFTLEEAQKAVAN